MIYSNSFPTLTYNLGKLIAVYSSFVIGYKYLIEPSLSKQMGESKIALNTIEITAATPYISIHLEKRKYLYSETLKTICDQLDNNTFIRIHKSTIVNISKVRSFKSRLNGDYDLLLTDGSSLRLSRT